MGLQVRRSHVEPIQLKMNLLTLARLLDIVLLQMVSNHPSVPELRKAAHKAA
jgi:hypothetical protein